MSGFSECCLIRKISFPTGILLNAIKSHILLNISSSISVNGGIQPMPDFTGSYGFWKDFYNGKRNPAITKADTGHRS